MLAERIRAALEILASDEQVGGTLRQQASAHLGEPVDNEALLYLKESARASYDNTYELAINADYSEEDADALAITMIMVAGASIGKRLGIEDGERFAREVGSVD